MESAGSDRALGYTSTGGRGGPRWPGHSVLVVPVPALEPLVRQRTRHYDAAYLSADPSFAHSHVTVLGPFVDAGDLTPAVLDQVRQVVCGHPPFVAEFAEVAQFPDGMIHLRVDDEGPFRRLTADLVDAFPAHRPYGGRYGDVRPHLTLDRAGPAVDVATVRGWVADILPAHTRVSEVRLSWYEQHACRTLARWPLGRLHGDAGPGSAP